MSTWLVRIALMAGLSTLGYARSVERLIVGPVVEAASPTDFSALETIYDTLCVLEEQAYVATESFCGGIEAVGQDYDVQAADDFVAVQAFHVTRITADFLTILGLCPDRVCLSTYPKQTSRCMAENDARAYLELGSESLTCEPFDDPLYGLKGLRMTVEVVDPLLLTAGHWFLSFQPSSPDFGAWVGGRFPPGPSCGETLCEPALRDGADYNPCCDGERLYYDDGWHGSGLFEYSTFAMRIEGIPAGDCVGGERVRARCKVRDGEQVGDLVVKVRGGQPDGAVTALLDPPDPQSMSIPLDGSGRGKGKFKGVPLGEHRVFVCDSIVDVTCAR